MKKFRLLFKYLRYYFAAQTKHDIHSPFVFDLLTNVISAKSNFYAYGQIEEIRKSLLSSKAKIIVQDFGAGSIVNKPSEANLKAVKDIAKASAKSPKYGQLLFRLVHYFKPKTLLELGTSFGISTLYQALPDKSAKLITMEGCENVAKLAQENFKKAGTTNIELITGNFDETLASALTSIKSLDYVFFDGNHKKEPTLRYFEKCLPLAHNDSLFIFDDIHWSDEMEGAWEAIKNNPQVTITIDLFFLGLVFFRKEQHKQHFIIRF